MSRRPFRRAAAFQGIEVADSIRKDVSDDNDSVDEEYERIQSKIERKRKAPPTPLFKTRKLSDPIPMDPEPKRRSMIDPLVLIGTKVIADSVAGMTKCAPTLAVSEGIRMDTSTINDDDGFQFNPRRRTKSSFIKPPENDGRMSEKSLSRFKSAFRDLNAAKSTSSVPMQVQDGQIGGLSRYSTKLDKGGRVVTLKSSIMTQLDYC